MKTKLLGIFVCMLLIATALPAVGTMNEIETPMVAGLGDNSVNHQSVTRDIMNSNRGAILWDNGMHYQGSIVSQWDPTGPFEAIGADDFQFEETTEITDVHWTGGYWNPGGDFDFDWNVSFYMDRGDGMAPGAKIYEQVFPNAEVHETFIEEIWNGWMFSYWVDLADAITFTGGEKYWISIQGVGFSPPDSYWGCHQPVVLHDLVWKSPQGGYPDWTSSTELFYHNALDFCFQLTGDGESPVPDFDCDGTLCWTDVEPGAIVNSTFVVINNGDVGSMLGWEVLSHPTWGTNWSAKWYYLDWLIMTDGGFVGTTTPEEIFVEVIAPDEPEETFTGEVVLVNSEDPDDTCIIDVSLATPVNQQVINPLLQMILERFPNAFPILRYLLGL